MFGKRANKALYPTNGVLRKEVHLHNTNNVLKDKVIP